MSFGFGFSLPTLGWHLSGGGASSGYSVTKSLRFRSSASAYLNRTFGAPTSGTTWTWSGWVKRGALGSLSEIFTGNSAVNITALEFQSSNTLYFQLGNGTTAYSIGTNAVFRDPAAWYHISVVADTTQASGTITGISTDRIKMYINGVQVTSFIGGSPTPPPQNYVGDWNLNGAAGNIGRWTSGAARYFDGEMAEINFVDGQALAPTAFGAFSTYNQWLPKKYAGTYGTNGFYLPFNATSATSYAGSFNGTSQYLTLPNNTAMNFGSGDFTVECWIKKTSSSAAGYDIVVQVGTGGSGLQGFTMEASSTRGYAWYTQPTPFILLNYTTSPDDGQWHHFAVSRTGSTTTMFVDGISRATYSGSYTIPSTATIVSIGAESSTPIYFFKGSISNLRLVKGTGLYTANFIPPTTALTAVTGTGLLTLQNATIVDNSSVGSTITNVNSVATSVQSPFLNPTVLTADSSGNGNNWTPNNISLTAGSTYDSLTDVPTLTSETVANYAVLNPLAKTSALVLSNANLTYTANATAYALTDATIQMPDTGKWYFEAFINNLATYSLNPTQYGNIKIGIKGSDGLYSIDATDSLGFANYSVSTPLSAPYAPAGLGGSNSGDTMMVAYDAATGKLWLGAKSSWSGGGNPSTGTTPTFTTIGTAGTYFPRAVVFENSVGSANFGQRPFTYTIPTDFLPLNTFNI